MDEPWQLVIDDDVMGKVHAAARLATRGLPPLVEIDEDDIAHQSLIRFWFWWERHGFQPVPPPYEMLPVIARRVALTALRRPAYRRRIAFDAAMVADKGEGPDAEDVGIDDDLKDALLMAMGQVPNRLRTDDLFVLLKMMGEPGAGMSALARDLSISRKKCRVAVGRIRKAMQEVELAAREMPLFAKVSLALLVGLELVYVRDIAADV